jgi:signal transduction histidine kinase
MAKVTHGESTDNLHTVRRRKDGALIDVSLTLSPITNRSGQTIGVSTIARNITRAVRLERQLQEQAKQLANEARLKDEFLAMLAHELRNPLAPIRNGIDVLRILPPSGEQAQQTLDMMEEQTNNLVRLIDDLLDVSRITRGKMELRRQRVALAKIITNAIQTAEQLIYATGHELTVVQARERLYAHGDPARLTQVVANLLNNAAKYTPPGGKILLTTERIGDEAAIRVKDNGSGIASEMLPHIFEMFVQADSSLNRTYGGLGIGLTLVKSLVEMHGGTVEVTSQGLGKGSEFTVRLPLLQASDAVPEEAIDSACETRAFPCHRMLIVDDLQPAALLVATILRSRGQQVRTAASGTEALAMIEQEKPELILSDISMPQMTGYELAQEIRRRPEWNDIWLVAVTGYGQESDKKRAKEAGFDDHLVKPISMANLECLLCR